jgi:hypothetical protein
LFKAHERTYGLRSRNLKEVKKTSVKIGNENDKLDDELNERNIVLHQRKHVNEEMSKLFLSVFLFYPSFFIRGT